MMPNDYYRCRIEAIRQLYNTVPDEKDKAVIARGFVPSHLEYQFDAILSPMYNDNFREKNNTPLTFEEITTYSNWFEMHPEKVAGKAKVTTSRMFPLQIDGTRQDVERMFEQALTYGNDTAKTRQKEPTQTSSSPADDTNKQRRMRLAEAEAVALALELELLKTKQTTTNSPLQQAKDIVYILTHGEEWKNHPIEERKKLEKKLSALLPKLSADDIFALKAVVATGNNQVMWGVVGWQSFEQRALNVHDFNEGIKKQTIVFEGKPKPITPNNYGVEKFCLKQKDDDGGRLRAMCGVYYDEETHRRVATDTHLLLAYSAGIPSQFANKIIDRQGNEIDKQFPDYKAVLPNDLSMYNSIKIDVPKLRKFVADCIEDIKQQTEIVYHTKAQHKQKHLKPQEAQVALKFADNIVSFYRLDLLEMFLGAMAMPIIMNSDTLYYHKIEDTKPLYTRSQYESRGYYGELIMMPMIGLNRQMKQYYYDLTK